MKKTFFIKILDPKRPLKNFNMFVLVVIAHGIEVDIILSSDKQRSMTVSDLIHKMDAMKDLKGRPKVLIMESCRGGNQNNGFEVVNFFKLRERKREREREREREEF
jgi:hypothetical protein